MRGVVGFKANDYMPFNDYASLTVGTKTLFSSNVATVGDYGASGWTQFVFWAPTAGSYTLTLSVANAGDNGVASGAVLDAVSTAVPEASTWAMLIAGFGLTGALARRRRLTPAAGGPGGAARIFG